MEKTRLTAVRVAQFACPTGKQQTFLRDAEVGSLALRATANGAKSYVFESKLGGKTVRITIGDPDTWTIPLAQAEARRLQTLVDSGRDPRAEKAATIAREQQARTAEEAAIARQRVIARDAWDAYCLEGKTNGTGRKPWGELHIRDHAAVSSRGGEKLKRGDGLTQPGLLSNLLDRPLVDLQPDLIEAWLVAERATRPTRTNLAFRLLRGFLNWCADQPAYQDLTNTKAHESRSVRSKLPPTNAKNDSLQRSQLKPWFAAVSRRGGLVTSTYLQCLLLTGARTNELAALRWTDVSFTWNTLELHDKVEGSRTVPLTPYVKALLLKLPTTKSPWVFASRSKSGHITDPSDTHNRALRDAGIEGLTLHGLRRSFASLAEWIKLPRGVVAQIQGHKPSATAEKHYIVREPDLLLLCHKRIERWMLKTADVLQPNMDNDRASSAAT
ncbi:MAG: preprotein translocase [Burkholderiales bacterium PBB6]|nr:MAG: preprotein translocase [Burkholderiales bacterium PBB6]